LTDSAIHFIGILPVFVF